MVCVDGVAYSPHRAIDVVDWNVDFYVLSLYKTYGPHHAALYCRMDHMLELDNLYHLFYGKDKIPAKMEPGNANYELSYASGAVVDWLNGDWGTFFVLTTIMVIPSLICLWFIRNKIKIGAN